ncbi:MAG TPA: indole-3-glycerol phosphate synthase TrpC [Gemmatimonadaceae bacterium]|nr:indole-3-glycerol phosphate synthase TrpC [Gemmatimonadaceae bacterium]
MLGHILAQTASRVEALRPRAGELERLAADEPDPPSLAAALSGRHVGVIAEIKRRSPSKGEINASLGAAEQARAYRDGGAAAISVLTEPASFGGSPEDLRATRAAVALPLLRKDFIVDEAQIVEARALGAAAVLLIVRALPPARLAELAAAARRWRLDALVEVRSERELELAAATDATLIGINSRDLETLELDPAVTERLLPLVPAGRVAVAESGVRTPADVERFAAAGADAVLVGSSLSAATDPSAAVRALAAFRRTGRGAR